MAQPGQAGLYELPELGRRRAAPSSGDLSAQAVLVAPATRTARGIPTEVRVGRADGMPAECVLSFDNLLTVPKGLPSG
jgi:mRNA-degrading endonuclease toxin of MazEF toxin-antitoxin module